MILHRIRGGLSVYSFFGCHHLYHIKPVYSLESSVFFHVAVVVVDLGNSVDIHQAMSLDRCSRKMLSEAWHDEAVDGYS